MEALFYSLIVAAISAITFIAYRHHENFAHFGPALAYLFMAVGWIAAAYKLGMNDGMYGVLKLDTEISAKEARKVLEFNDKVAFYTMIGGFLSFAYIQLLMWLPDLLGLKKQEDE